jgi:hypothetical protein
MGGARKNRKVKEEKRVKEGERLWTEEDEGNEGRYGEGKKTGKETQGIEEDRNEHSREICGKTYKKKMKRNKGIEEDRNEPSREICGKPYKERK